MEVLFSERKRERDAGVPLLIVIPPSKFKNLNKNNLMIL